MFAAVSERRLDAAPPRVFEFLTDAAHYPTWLVGARRVVVDDPHWPRPGSSFHHEVGAGPIEVHDATSVVGLEPWRRLDLVVRARPFLIADVRFEVEPHGSGTTLRMTEEPRGPFRVMSPLIWPFVRARNDRSLRRLAELVDGRAG
jgi:uncharacterized protein YndB with AHSA1/START domain